MADAFSFGQGMPGTEPFAPEAESDEEKDDGPKISEVVDDLD